MKNEKIVWKYASVSKYGGVLKFNKNGKKVEPQLLKEYKNLIGKHSGWIRMPMSLFKVIALLLICLPLFGQITIKEDIDTKNLKRVLLSCKKDHVARFIVQNYKLAKKAEEEYKIPPAIFLAQMALESGFGRSRLALQHCNYFGIRGAHRYLSFNSKEICANVYCEVFNQRCYRNIQPSSIDEWIETLECCHYASSKQYKAKLRSIIKQYKLDIL
jgi:hypothetical protein